MRCVYRLLLLLHPTSFRDRYSDEMLWIFEETRETVGVYRLLGDALLSLARQWGMRSAAWKVALAIALTTIEIAVLSTMV